jgi:hypothetical protein
MQGDAPRRKLNRCGDHATTDHRFECVSEHESAEDSTGIGKQWKVGGQFLQNIETIMDMCRRTADRIKLFRGNA